MFSLRQINSQTLCDKIVVINKNLFYISLEFKRRIHTSIYIYIQSRAATHYHSAQTGD